MKATVNSLTAGGFLQSVPGYDAYFEFSIHRNSALVHIEFAWGKPSFVIIPKNANILFVDILCVPFFNLVLLYLHFNIDEQKKTKCTLILDVTCGKLI